MWQFKYIGWKAGSRDWRWCFQDKKTITGVNIPEGIKTIGHDAFAHTNLQELNLPSSLERIGYSVIYGVTGVTNVNIPKGIENCRCMLEQ